MLKCIAGIVNHYIFIAKPRNPYAYIIFIFTSSRCAGDVRRLLPAVIRVCFGEGTMLLLVWLWGRYWLAA